MLKPGYRSFNFVYFSIQFLCTVEYELVKPTAYDFPAGLCEGVKLDVYYPGFPTLYHVEHGVNLNIIDCCN